MKNEPKCLADLIIELGQRTKKRDGVDMEILEAAAWLTWDVVNASTLTPSSRRVLLGYKSARDARIKRAMEKDTVAMAVSAGLPKSQELSARQRQRLITEGKIFHWIKDNRGRKVPVPETAFEAASRLLGPAPNTIRKKLAIKARGKR